MLVVGDCSAGGETEPDVFALVKPDAVDTFRVIYRAWRVDRRQRRFAPIRSQGIQCRNEGYGG
jgi:hypothetical protein